MTDEEQQEPEPAELQDETNRYVIKPAQPGGGHVHLNLDNIPSPPAFDRERMPEKFTTSDILGMNEYDVEWVREQLADDEGRLAQFEAAYEEATAPIKFKISTDLPKYDFGGTGPISDLAEAIRASTKVSVKPLDTGTITGMRNLSDMILNLQSSSNSQFQAELDRVLKSLQTPSIASPPNITPPATELRRNPAAATSPTPLPTIAETIARIEDAFGPVGRLMSQMVDLGKGQLAILEKQTEIVETQSEANRIESGFGLFISCVFVATLVVTIHGESPPLIKWGLAIVSAAATYGLWRLYERLQKKMKR